MTRPAITDAESELLDKLAATPASMWDVSFAITTSNEATICAIKSLVQCLESAGELRPGAYVEALMEQEQTTGGNQFARDYLRTLMGITGPANPANPPVIN